MPASVDRRAARGNQRQPFSRRIRPISPDPRHATAGMPGHGDRLLFTHAVAKRDELAGNITKHVGEKADGVDAVGKGCSIVAPSALGTHGLPGIKRLPNNTLRPVAKNRSKQQRVGIAKNGTAKTNDQQDLDQIVQGETQKSIHIAANKPGWRDGALSRWFRTQRSPSDASRTCKPDQSKLRSLRSPPISTWRWVVIAAGARLKLLIHPGTRARASY